MKLAAICATVNWDREGGSTDGVGAFFGTMTSLVVIVVVVWQRVILSFQSRYHFVDLKG